ncbi:MAG: type II toxin-antitoxin system RelE/ParE family toxin [Rhodocyclaceae bacterium]|nr:type II toxin-antitoxin system RelE/ParE family toxin [Rhodocyclaceae bacterium]
MTWYLRNAGPGLADRFLSAVRETAEMSLEFPTMGFRHRFRHPGLEGILILPVRGFKKHLLLYRPSEAGIELIRVYHAARDIDAIDPGQARGGG